MLSSLRRHTVFILSPKKDGAAYVVHSSCLLLSIQNHQWPVSCIMLIYPYLEYSDVIEGQYEKKVYVHVYKKDCF